MFAKHAAFVLVLLSPLLLQTSYASSNPIFLTAPTYATGATQNQWFVLADVNGDGIQDVIAAVNQCDRTVCDGLVAVLLGNGDGSFQPAVQYGSGQLNAYDLAVGDVNGDGKPDVLVANACGGVNTEFMCTGPGNVMLLLGDGAGHFGTPTPVVPPSALPVSFVVADVNGDGKLDMLLVNGDKTSIGVLLGNGNGTFNAPTNYGSGGYNAQTVILADLNGDGKPDLVVPNFCVTSSNCTTASTGVLLGNGDGTFQTAVSHTSANFYATVGDVNGDGKLDLILAGASISVLLGNGDGTFQQAVTSNVLPGGASPTVVGDINGDGKPDLVTVDFGGIGVLLGNGNGTFQPPSHYAVGGASATGGVYSLIRGGDVNGDGKLDVLALTPNGLSVLLGNGDGTFAAPPAYRAGLREGDLLDALAVADINGDGKLDLLTSTACATTDCSSGSGTVNVLLGNGSGGFQLTATYPSGGKEAQGVVAADVNGDGKPDLFVANECAPSGICSSGFASVGVLLNKGDGTFKQAVTYSSGGYEALSPVVADVNGDGKPDLLVTNSCSVSPCGSSLSSVGVLLGNGDGTFQPPVNYAAGGYNSPDVIVTDLNGDGKVDLLVSSFCDSLPACTQGVVSVLLGNGDGTFQSAVTYGSGGSGTYSMALGDINGDGKPDVVVGSQSSCNGTNSGSCGFGGIGVLLGNGDGTFQPAVTIGPTGVSERLSLADFNGDGKLDLADSTLRLGNGDGTFQPPLPLLGAGVPADFNGDGRPDLVTTASNYVVVLLNVSSANTADTVTLASSANPALTNQNVTFTATVSGSGVTPSGSVTFKNGSTTVGVASLIGGQATFTKAFPVAGQKSITATYSGNFDYASTSAALSETVLSSNPTATTLASNVNPALVGQSVALTVSVSATVGTPAGTITFKKNGATFATATLNNGQAILNYAFGSAGTKSIIAVYSGGTGFNSSTSTALSEVVNTAGTTTSLVSSLNPSTVGQSITFTATVSSSSGSPTGTVTFMNGTVAMGTVTLSGGQAILNKTFPAAGMKSITAVYSGDAAFASSTSSALSQTVNQASTTTMLASSQNPSTVGQSVTLTATVTPQFSGTPTGTVTFMNGSTAIGTVTLSGGQASLNKTFPVAGMKSLTAIYSGDANFTTSSGSLTQTVN